MGSKRALLLVPLSRKQARRVNSGASLGAHIMAINAELPKRSGGCRRAGVGQTSRMRRMMMMMVVVMMMMMIW